MKRWGRRILTGAAPAIILGVVGFCYTHANSVEESGDVSVCRHRWADGNGSREVDLPRLSDRYDRLARAVKENLESSSFMQREKARVISHHSGLPSCRSRTSRRAKLREVVPAKYRRLVLYFVTVTERGSRPGVLPRSLPRNAIVFALESRSTKDLVKLAKDLRRPVTLATAAFARALGVRCRDARVTISGDGRWANVLEVHP